MKQPDFDGKMQENHLDFSKDLTVFFQGHRLPEAFWGKPRSGGLG
jgi:hypothetical protein